VKELRKMDLYSQYAMVTAAEAIAYLVWSCKKLIWTALALSGLPGMEGSKPLRSKLQSLHSIIMYPDLILSLFPG
jgi:3-oxoacyl-(acyl-carrier-protein) synthase